MITRPLTATEERVARLVAHGRDTADVAAELGLTSETVAWHLARIMRKLGARSHAELPGLLAARDR